jgi:hypothetical protein
MDESGNTYDEYVHIFLFWNFKLQGFDENRKKNKTY